MSLMSKSKSGFEMVWVRRISKEWFNRVLAFSFRAA